MEELIQYVWKHRIYDPTALRTTAGEEVEVVDPGLPNRDAGPDFFNAKVKMGGVLWVGNVEVHQRSSDWYVHGHQDNAAYNNVILHVVGEADTAVGNLPQLVLPCPASVRTGYEMLKRMDAYPACAMVVGSLSRLMLHSWMSALQMERLQQKAQLIMQRLRRADMRWEHVFFITLSRNFGFGLNGDAFEQWASRIDYAALAKHRDNLLQVEAVFFGMAGLLQAQTTDSYLLALQGEWHYMRHKFDMNPLADASQWRLLRIRPSAFPHIKIAQLAWLFHSRDMLFSAVMQASTVAEVKRLLQLDTSTYWRSHYLFGRVCSDTGGTALVLDRKLGDKSLDLLVINTVIPFLYAYGQHKGSEELCLRATAFLEQLKPENNYITRHWEAMGVKAENAADTQALIQLRKEYCDKRDCLRCRIGYEYLKAKR